MHTHARQPSRPSHSPTAAAVVVIVVHPHLMTGGCVGFEGAQNKKCEERVFARKAASRKSHRVSLMMLVELSCLRSYVFLGSTYTSNQYRCFNCLNNHSEETTVKELKATTDDKKLNCIPRPTRVSSIGPRDRLNLVSATSALYSRRARVCMEMSRRAWNRSLDSLGFLKGVCPV